MAKDSSPVTFVVLGQSAPAGVRPESASIGQIKAAARVGARRAGGEAVRLEATPGEDIVLLHIANGPTLYLHPEDARELLKAQRSNQVSRGAQEASSSDESVIVPPQLVWDDLDSDTGPAATRGKVTEWIGNVVLDAVEIVTGLFKDKAADIAAAAVTKKVDEQVDPGVYQLEPNALPMLKGVGQKLAKVPAPANPNDPLLVLVHGTFSNTSGTFSKLWTQHPNRVAAIFERYGGRVYGLEHETLGVSPFANALNLVRALPDGANLHLMTHSRGGIVAEVLARICAGHGATKDDLALFDGKGYEQHRADLEALAREVRRRNIKVERIVRVACPARGTLLASRRLDAYLSVLKWSMELAGVVVLPQLVGFLAEVARRRTDPAELPGVEAMMPDRPMMKWLNAPADPVDSDLRVVAGDIEGDSVVTWLKTLLSDAFYWTDNDLVVQTRSMYGGTPRAEGKARFVLDRGGKVTHFNYFGNERTAGLLTSALLEEDPEQFRPIGPLSWSGKDSSGTRAARAAVKRSHEGNVAERPAVFVLPGILGSHLKVDGKRVWLSIRFISGLERLRWDPRTADRVAPDGPVDMSYEALIERLADTHEVFPFAFDWRRPIEDEAKRLAAEVEKALAVREATKQPVRFVAHSMGGLVVRTMRLEAPETWKKVMEREGARFLMLGTPNGGSFAPMQVLTGDDPFGNLFTTWGGLFDGLGQRNLVAGMPGLLQLQAGLLDGELKLGLRSTWERLEEADLKKIRRRIRHKAFWHRDPAQQREMRWGIPPQEVLDRAVALRKRLDEQRAEFADGKTLLVVGKAKATPAGIKELEEDERVVYLDTADGDGRVTLENALLPGVPTWQVDVVHGELANAKKAFDAYVELLQKGETAELPVVTPSARRGVERGERAQILTYSRPSRTMRADVPPSGMNEVFAGEAERERPAAEPGMRLNVRVLNANLKFVREPLLVGHYESLRLTGAERVIDDLIGNTMSESLRCGSYPTVIGSNQVFTNSRRPTGNPFALPRPEAAIVVGLGEEGSLRMSELVETIRQGTLAYAQRLVERGGVVPTTFSLASTLIGSGGTSISPATSAQAVTLGVAEANARLAEIGWPIVSRLNLIEMYRDRASEALTALKAFADSMARGIEVEPRIAVGQGALPRPVDGGYRGVNSDFVSIREQRRSDGSAEYEFTLSTRRARDEVRGSVAQSKLLQHLVSKGATDENEDTGIGRALFKLLVPLEIEPFLAGSTSLVLQLDSATAAYPWEMLDIDRSEAERTSGSAPWGIQTRLLRKLRTDTYRAKPRTADSSTGVLVIGEPQCPPEYPSLPGAVAEAREVARLLGVNPLLNKQAKQITQAVLNSSFAILHVSGHGDFFKDNDKEIGGVVLSDGMLFSAREVESMRIVPQLAFINCCHLGSMRNADMPTSWRDARPRLAANVAEQLIRIGVRCVVAAGWAVHDEPAMLFAKTFYQRLLQGWRFIDAVAEARARTYDAYPWSNTWAAYQCYGDPDWTYQGARPSKSDGSYAPEVSSADDLRVQLETIAVSHKFEDLEDEEVRKTREAQRARQLIVLEGLASKGWDRQGAVAAAFGAAYAEIENFDRAIYWYERATEAADGGAGLNALEQLGNVMSRHGAMTGNREQIEKAIGLLERVHAIGATIERESLLGSAYKRLALVATSERDKRDALAKSLRYYTSATDRARESAPTELFYPALNCISLQLVLRGPKSRMPLDPKLIEETRRSAAQKHADDPDFWSAMAGVELALYEALASGDLAAALKPILIDLEDVVRRTRSRREWSSVIEQFHWILDHYRGTPGLPQKEREAIDKLLRALPTGIAKAAKRSATASTRNTRTTRKQSAKRPAAKKKAKKK